MRITHTNYEFVSFVIFTLFCVYKWLIHSDLGFFQVFNYEFHLLNILWMMMMMIMKWNWNYEVLTSMFKRK